MQEELAKIGDEELENILLELDYLKDSINGLEQKRTNAKTYNSEINLIVRQHSDRLNELRNASDSKELVALKSHLESADKDYEETEKSLVEWEKHDSLSENSKANQTEEYNVKPVMSGTVNNEQTEPNECESQTTIEPDCKIIWETKRLRKKRRVTFSDKVSIE